jgi:hypothetical protein
MDFVLNGIAPEGTVAWPHAGIVTKLRKAAETLTADGWARCVSHPLRAYRARPAARD